MDVMTRVPVREQDPQVRAANFEEVCLGYNAEEAMAEAARCLNCKKCTVHEGLSGIHQYSGVYRAGKRGQF